MPELPEVESLAAYLRATATGAARRARRARRDQRAQDLRPACHRPRRRARLDAARRGKFLDVASPTRTARCCTSSTHLARAGLAALAQGDERRRRPSPGKGPLALRVALVDDDGVPAGGFDLTEAGTRKSLAVYVVRDPQDVAGRRAPRPRAARRRLHLDALAAILADAGGKQLKGVLRDQSTIAGIGNAYSDDILHAARLSRSRPRASSTPDEIATLTPRSTTCSPTQCSARRGSGAADLKAEKKLGMRVHGRTGQPCPVCGDVVREVSFADSLAAVLRDLPDRRQTARRPPPLRSSSSERGGASLLEQLSTLARRRRRRSTSSPTPTSSRRTATTGRGACRTVPRASCVRPTPPRSPRSCGLRRARRARSFRRAATPGSSAARCPARTDRRGACLDARLTRLDPVDDARRQVTAGAGVTLAALHATRARPAGSTASTSPRATRRRSAARSRPTRAASASSATA